MNSNVKHDPGVVFGTTGNNGRCQKCGKPFTYLGDVPAEGYAPGMAPWCDCGGKVIKITEPLPEIPTPTFQNIGWVCPKCGRGNAPWSQTCPCVNTPLVPGLLNEEGVCGTHQ